MGGTSESDYTRHPNGLALSDNDEDNHTEEMAEEPDGRVVVLETAEERATGTMRLSRVQSLLEMTRRSARKESVRLIGLMLIVLASIACAACDVERDFFTNIVSMILGLLVKSPIDINPDTNDNPSTSTATTSTRDYPYPSNTATDHDYDHGRRGLEM